MATSRCAMARDYSIQDGDCVLLPYLDPRRACFRAERLPAAIREVAKPHAERGGSWAVFAGKVGKASVRARAVRLDAEHSRPDAELRKVVASAIAEAKKEDKKRIVVLLDGDSPRTDPPKKTDVSTKGASPEDLALAAHEGALLGGYSFDRYLKKKARPAPVLVVCGGRRLTALRRSVAARSLVLDAVNQARDLLNEPPNVIRPPSLARAFEKLGRAAGLRVTVWDERRLARERCGGIVGVGQGSAAPPRLVMAEYAPRRARGHLCLVGKGVTFDSGGYGLKPADSQIGMKYDMGGAAMMFAAACAIARLRLPIRVTVLTPLVENAISGEAYHTTSILRTRSGRTIEVHHTDAEGRIILADALTLAVERAPDWIVDAATLTGACVVALGEDIAGAYGTDPAFTKALISAGNREGELFWELPLHMPYEDQIKSTIADCKNVGSRWGGSITAAIFLKAWVPAGKRWIHCDIAGPAGKEDTLGHLGKGAKGFGVKTLVALARELARS